MMTNSGTLHKLPFVISLTLVRLHFAENEEAALGISHPLVARALGRQGLDGWRASVQLPVWLSMRAVVRLAPPTRGRGRGKCKPGKRLQQRGLKEMIGASCFVTARLGFRRHAWMVKAPHWAGHCEGAPGGRSGLGSKHSRFRDMDRCRKTHS